MKSRPLLISIILLVVLIAGFIGFLFFSENALRNQFKLLTEALEEQGYEVSMQSPVAERTNGLVKTSEVYIEHPEEGISLYLQHVEMGVSTGDLLRYMLPFSGGLADLRQARIHLSGARFRQEKRGTGFDFDVLELSLDGNLGDFARAAATRFAVMPEEFQQLTGNLVGFSAFYDTKLDFMEFEVPYPEISRVFVEMGYSPEADRLDITRAELSVFNALLSLAGHVDQVSAAQAALASSKEQASELNRMLSMAAELKPVDGDTLHIGADGLGLSFDVFEVDYEGIMNPGQSLRESFFSGQVSVSTRIENLMLRSPQTFRSTYGQPLRFLGISPDGIRIEGLQLAYSIQGDEATINSFELLNPFADVNFVGGLHYEDGEDRSRWKWENAGFHITPKTAESNRFINTFANFFSLDIPEHRPGEDHEFPTYQLAIKGSLGSPDIQL